MSDPRFVPSSWCVNRKDFGKRDVIAWKLNQVTSDDGLDQLRVAQVHHDTVCQLWRALHGKGWTVQEYADVAGYSRNRMTKMMGGSVLLRLEDVAAMERLFGIAFMPATLQQRPLSDEDD